MSKNAKKQAGKVPSVPEMYRSVPIRPETHKLCLIEDIHHQFFLFSTPQECHIVKPAIHKTWMGVEAFLNEPKQTMLAYHAEIFRAEPPADTDLDAAGTWSWYALVSQAIDRTTKIRRDPITDRKSTYTTRKYTLGKITPADNEIAGILKTPQMIACYKIFKESLKDGAIQEADLKITIVNRAGELHTKQDPWRIFQYYRPQLIKLNLLRHD